MKGLLCKYEDLSSDPPPTQKPDVVACILTLEVGRGKTNRSEVLLASRSS